ncbi:MAG: BadF/BadG/BcrA/BcrD ATPase family protein [Anaerolineaceae bacterium]
MTLYVLGIDGGGTSTRAAILDEKGKLLGIGIGGASNYDDIGVEATKENISKTVQSACQMASLSECSFNAIFLGLAGLSSEADRNIVRQIATELNLAPSNHIGIDHDIRIALAGGLSGRPGIVQIAGTGSSCYGRNFEGLSWRSGGWGPLIADEGSGYWLGIQAMRAATRAADGRAKPTVLTKMVLDKLNISEIDEILSRIYAHNISRSEIAEIGPSVIEAAKMGDETAKAIIDLGAEDLAECILTVAKKLKFTDRFEVALTGGVFKAGETVINPLRKVVHEEMPACSIMLAELPPVIGACLLALEQLDLHLSSDELDTLQHYVETIKLTL